MCQIECQKMHNAIGKMPERMPQQKKCPKECETIHRIVCMKKCWNTRECVRELFDERKRNKEALQAKGVRLRHFTYMPNRNQKACQPVVRGSSEYMPDRMSGNLPDLPDRLLAARKNVMVHHEFRSDIVIQSASCKSFTPNNIISQVPCRDCFPSENFRLLALSICK